MLVLITNIVLITFLTITTHFKNELNSNKDIFYF